MARNLSVTHPTHTTVRYHRVLKNETQLSTLGSNQKDRLRETRHLFYLTDFEGRKKTVVRVMGSDDQPMTGRGLHVLGTRRRTGTVRETIRSCILFYDVKEPVSSRRVKLT